MRTAESGWQLLLREPHTNFGLAGPELVTSRWPAERRERFSKMTARFTITKVLNELNVEFGKDDRDVFAFAPDLAKALGYANTHKMMEHVEPEDAGHLFRVTRSKNGVEQRRKQGIVYRDGILDAVWGSKLPNAKAIKKQIKDILRELETEGVVVADDITRDESARAMGKIARHALTDGIKLQQQATDDDRSFWYANFTRLVCKHADVPVGDRDILSDAELKRLDEVETTVAARLLNREYETVSAAYQDVKSFLEMVYPVEVTI